MAVSSGSYSENNRQAPWETKKLHVTTFFPTEYKLFRGLCVCVCVCTCMHDNRIKLSYVI